MENIAMSVVVVSKDSLQEQMRVLFGEFSGFPDEDRDACEDLLTSGMAEWEVCDELSIKDGRSYYRGIANYVARLLSKEEALDAAGITEVQAKNIAEAITALYCRVVWFDVLEMSNDSTAMADIYSNFRVWLEKQSVHTYYGMLPKFSREIVLREFMLDSCWELSNWVRTHQNSPLSEYIETFGISRKDLMGYYDAAEMIERCQLKTNWEISGFVSELDGGAILKFES